MPLPMELNNGSSASDDFLSTKVSFQPVYDSANAMAQTTGLKDFFSPGSSFASNSYNSLITKQNSGGKNGVVDNYVA
jgi:hypothetical protein